MIAKVKSAQAQIVKKVKAIPALRHLLGWRREWYEDLCEYYGVTPQQAEELGIRSEERRPDLPASPTTHAVSGMTMAQIWESKPRNTAKEIFQWQKDLGAWSSFRQCYYHREDCFDWLVADLPSGSKYCEYA